MEQELGCLAAPYELARENPDRPVAPMPEQLRTGLALLDGAAAELRAVADRIGPDGSLCAYDPRPPEQS